MGHPFSQAHGRTAADEYSAVIGILIVGCLATVPLILALRRTGRPAA